MQSIKGKTMVVSILIVIALLFLLVIAILARINNNIIKIAEQILHKLK